MATIKYKIIKKFFTKEELEVYQRYCYTELDHSSYTMDGQSFSPAWYKDSLMEALLYNKLPRVEKESGLNLFPTYAYWKYYVFGATLKKHVDRPSCEISITSCIKKYDNWPIIIEKDSFELNEGDAILYRGCDHLHGRPGVYKGEGMAQIFLHYVNQKGPNKEHAYDNVRKNS